VEIRVGELQIAKSLVIWINDGLMAVFFLLVGLELKREVLEGELARPSQVALPTIAAVGGMAVPALIYAWINRGDTIALQGWAIPSATDIAFSLGVLSLLGRRVPYQLKLFLLTLAIIDDLGAIIVIAVFYSGGLSLVSGLVALGAIALLAFLNRRGTVDIVPYMLVGLVLWVAVLKSGVHATLAGVVLALFIPLKTPGDETAPLRRLEHDLHPSVAFVILPMFAFANTGISFAGLSLESFTAPVPLGIAAGLVIGKPLGIVLLTWLAVVLGIGRLPSGVSWNTLFGMSVLCGIGFTMSLFISSLAFEGVGRAISVDDRIGILTGSLLSALLGYFILRASLGRDTTPAKASNPGK